MSEQSLSIHGLVRDDIIEEGSLYDECLIRGLQMNNSPDATGCNLQMRPLKTGDFERGFMEVLSELTVVGNVSKVDFLKRYNAMKGCNGTYFVTVIEDVQTNTIIGTASLVLERKFIRGCAKKGIIEDVVIRQSFRGRQLGKWIVGSLIALGKALGCYKISLNCSDAMVGYYGSLGFKHEEGNANFLQLRT